MQTNSIPLYNLERFKLFKLAEQPKVPPASLHVTPEWNDVYKLHNIDGMYSYCTNVETQEVHHFAAWTEVIPVKASSKDSI
jgi:hypothetical protein